MNNKKGVSYGVIILIYVLFVSGVIFWATRPTIIGDVNLKVVVFGNGAILVTCLFIFIFAYIRDLYLPDRQKRHEEELNSIAEGWEWREGGTKKKMGPATVRHVIEYGGGEDLSGLRGPVSCVKKAIFIGVLLWIAIIIVSWRYLAISGTGTRQIILTCTVTALTSIILLFTFSLVLTFISRIFFISWPTANNEKSLK